MAVGPILTLGLGSYSTIGKLVTLGYGVSEEAPPEPPVVTTTPTPPGGGWGWGRGGRRRTTSDVLAGRRAVGLLPAVEDAISDVAARQVERNEQDELKRLEELIRELQMRGLEWESRYYGALAQQREYLIAQEIARFKANEDALLLALMAASVL